MKTAPKEVQHLYRRKHYAFDLEAFEVDLVQNPDKPVCVTLRSSNGECIEIFAAPSVADRFGKSIQAQAAKWVTLAPPRS